MLKVKRVVTMLDRGGFGLVEKVELENGSLVARKTFSPSSATFSLAEVDKLRERFRREVLIQSKLNSNFVIPIIGTDLNGDAPAYLMPLASQSLRQKLEKDGSNKAYEIKVLVEVFNCLEEIHRLGFVHRDLKPENILYHDGRWKLSDFGLALPPTDTTNRLTSEYSAWGSEMYCAPEQVMDFRKATSLADIYSLGCIIHDFVSDEKRIPYRRHSHDGPYGPLIEKATEIDLKKRIKNITIFRELFSRVFDSAMYRDLSEEGSEWAVDLENISAWPPEKFESFARYLRMHKESRSGLFASLDQEKIKVLFGAEESIVSEISEYLFDWAEGSFGFEYCDVIGRKLATIFEMGSVAIKARAAVAMARLAANHNRWFVMEILVSLLGRNCDQSVAERVGLEIIADQLQGVFIVCCEAINKNHRHYHEEISCLLGE